MKFSKEITGRNESSLAFRRPQQQRGRERFEAILDATDRLLIENEPGQLSIYVIAEEAGIAPPSIYHFFPDLDCVYLALAERLHEQFVSNIGEPPDDAKQSWQALNVYRFGVARDLYNSTPSARKLLLGSGISAALIARDKEFDRRFAELGVEELNQLFYIPDDPNLVDRIMELLVINDALWALSVHRHGFITDELEDKARRARFAYARTFLPEYVERRD